MNTIIAPSLLAADFANLQRDIEMINKSDADWLHIDIMDGVFVPNISFGQPVLASMQKHVDIHLDFHLMIVDPDKYIPEFVQLGAKSITVHYEVCEDLKGTIDLIKSYNILAGVVINPDTPVEVLDDIISEVDMVLIMSVNPGHGGQKFIEGTYDKVRKTKQMCLQKNISPIIEVDGGVNADNAIKLVDAGANALVAGSFVFKAEDPIHTIADLKNVTSVS